MKVFVKTILALLLALPLAAQAPSASLWHFGERSGHMYEGLRALLGTDELVEMGMRFNSMQTDSPRYAPLASELRLSPASAWALADNKGRCLLQGGELPTAEELRKALDDAGIKSQVEILRSFLKRHPYQLDARVELLRLLRGIAEARTRRVLQVDVESERDLIRRGDVEGDYYTYSGALHFDASPFEGKKLEAEQDEKIWGAYAQELRALFSGEDWRALMNYPSPFYTYVPVEVCSQTMVQDYGRHIKIIEDFFKEHGENDGAWQWYAWMRCIAKQGTPKLQPIDVLLEGLPSRPGMRTDMMPMPLSLLILEERETGNWDSLAAKLWSKWPMFRYIEWLESAFFESYASRPRKQGELEVSWRDRIKPLLESLIKTNRIEDAESVIFSTAKSNAGLEIQRRAVELALDCGRKDLNAKWRSLTIQDKLSPSDPNDVESLYFQITPYWSNISLVVINGKQLDSQIWTLFSHSQLIEWNIDHAMLNSGQSELLRQLEGWPKDTTYWALRDKSGTLAHGAGLPSASEIFQVLIDSMIEKSVDVLRRFILEHPENMDAKMRLQYELRRLAEAKTHEKLSGLAKNDATPMLTEDDDRDIWGEFATRFNHLMLTLLEHPLPGMIDMDSFCRSYDFKHSQIMKEAARTLLPNIEASLQRQPSHEGLWQAWSTMSTLEGRRRFKDFRETLLLSPTADPRDFPPSRSLFWLMLNYHDESDWTTIIDLLASPWEARRESVSKLGEWDSKIQYLFEAYLRLGRESEANDLLMYWEPSPAWGTALEAAIGLAEKCGRDALAEKWKKLK